MNSGPGPTSYFRKLNLLKQTLAPLAKKRRGKKPNYHRALLDGNTLNCNVLEYARYRPKRAKKFNGTLLPEVKGTWLRPEEQKGDDELTVIDFFPAH